MSYKEHLESNNADLQTILDKVNALPESTGGAAENLDAEFVTQETLLTEQNAKIAELSEILASKASGGNIESWNGKINNMSVPSCVVYYTDETLTSRIENVKNVYPDVAETKNITIAANTMIYIEFMNQCEVSNVDRISDYSPLLVPTANNFTVTIIN